MIHARPTEYYNLYQSFKGGSTIRQWIDAVESMSRTVPNLDIEYNRIQLTDQLPATWKVVYDKEFKATGTKNMPAIQMMREIGAFFNPATKEWIFTLDQLVEYIARDEINKFKGDMLEVFSELFFNSFENAEWGGIREYTPIELSSDFGVDARGINVNGNECVIQVKYRFNPEENIPYADIARTFTSGVCQMGIDLVGNSHTVYLFTIAKGATWVCEKVLGNKLVVLNRKEIAIKVDNNLNFWLRAWNEVKDTLNA